MKEELRPSRIILTLLNEKNTLGSVEKYSRETNVGNIDAAAGQTLNILIGEQEYNQRQIDERPKA